MRFFPLILLAQFLLITPLFAADAPVTLPEVVVTASAEATPVKELPVSVQVIP